MSEQQSKRASLWTQFQQRWQDCTECPLHKGRRSVVLAKGKLPCDVLFAGEAPGNSEDALGVPFSGPAGHLLDQIVEQSVPSHLRLAYCNLICCIPLGEDGVKTAEPPEESIKACSQRLIEFVDIARPRLLVCVGRLAEKWLDPLNKKGVKLRWNPTVGQCHITHPSAMLKALPVSRPLMLQKAVVNLREACEELQGEK